MRKLIGILSLFVVVALCACNQNSKSNAPDEATSTTEESQAVTETPETPPAEEVQYVDHVCSDKCTAEDCHFECGEKGHVCDDSCS